MKKVVVILIFLVGLGVFSYPIVSNMLSTKVHQSVVQDYSETIENTDKKKIEKEKKKADEHNQELAESEIDFVDPFSEESQSDGNLGNKSYYNALNIGPAIGVVEIPKIKVELPIYHGSNEDVLSEGVGHLENSSLPTGKNGTHSVLTAHRGLPSAKLFRNLDELTVGDEFYVQVLDEVFAYKVQDINVVLPHETDWLRMQEDKNLVTLLTCDPYMVNTHRMLVTGERIPYEPSEKTKASGSNDEDKNIYFFISLAVGLIVIFIIIWFLRRKKQYKEGGGS